MKKLILSALVLISFNTFSQDDFSKYFNKSPREVLKIYGRHIIDEEIYNNEYYITVETVDKNFTIITFIYNDTMVCNKLLINSNKIISNNNKYIVEPFDIEIIENDTTYMYKIIKK